MVLMKREINDVTFSADEVGVAIANASDSAQRDVLLALVRCVEGWSQTGGSWPFQCRLIIDGTGKSGGLSQSERNSIASVLDVLLEHINEPVESV
jgi:hypothetical protein